MHSSITLSEKASDDDGDRFAHTTAQQLWVVGGAGMDIPHLILEAFRGQATEENQLSSPSRTRNRLTWDP